MPVITTSQGSSWASNVYVIVTIRFFGLMGVAFLIRFMYIRVSATWGSRLASTFACKQFFVQTFLLMAIHMADQRSCPVAAMSSLGLEEIELDPLPAASGAGDIEPGLEVNLTPLGRSPRRSYDPQEHMQRSQASPRAHGQRMGTPESSIAANAIPEQDVGVRHGTTHIEEDSGLTVELGG